MNRLKEARMRCGIAQKTIADLLDVSIQSVSNWENDSRSPSKKNIKKLSEIYGVTMEYLLDTEVENIQPVAETKKEPAIVDEFLGLTEAERQLLKSFRRCTPVSRARVLAYAEGASDHL